jgi:L-fuconolactonase
MRMNSMSRRSLLIAGGAVGLAATHASAQSAPAVPIIDSHIHLWDTTRPQGSVFPGPSRPGARPKVSAEIHRTELAPEGVVGAIAVEASPWIEDNLWLLESCAADPFMVGAVGNLKPEAKEFPEYLERYNKHPLYLGIRYGNLWGYSIVEQVKNPAFMDGVKRLADAGLMLDVGNPKVDLMQAALRISDAAPNLTIVIEHMATFEPAPEEQPAFEAILREVRQRPQVYVKISAFGRVGQMSAERPLSEHRARLDRLFEAFGEDRVIGGGYASKTSADLRLMREYLATKPKAVAEKFFWKNSAKAYRWTPRTPAQPRLVGT